MGIDVRAGLMILFAVVALEFTVGIVTLLINYGVIK